MMTLLKQGSILKTIDKTTNWPFYTFYVRLPPAFLFSLDNKIPQKL